MRIYFDSNTQKIKNNYESFIVYNDYAILNRLSEFPAPLVKTETRIFTNIFNVMYVVVKTTFRRLLTMLQSLLGMSVTTQGGSGRQYVTGSRRNLSKYRFVLLNVYRFRET